MKISIEELIEIYKEVKSIRKAAKLSGYSKSSVQFLLNKNNIILFPRSRSGIENSQSKALEKLNIDDPRRLVRNFDYMNEMYVNKKYSIPKIAKILKLSTSTVLTGLKQCNIARRPKSEALKIAIKANPKMRIGLKGSKNHAWRGGLTGWRKLSRDRLKSCFVRLVMQRDEFKCQWCNSIKNIVVHHHNRRFKFIVDLVRQTVSESNVLEFADAIVNEHKLSDGITLCKICHDNYHKINGK